MLSAQEKKQIKTDVIKSLAKLGINEESSSLFLENQEQLTESEQHYQLTPSEKYEYLKNKRTEFLENMINISINKNAWSGISYHGSYMNEVNLSIDNSYKFYDSHNETYIRHGSVNTTIHYLNNRHDAFYINKQMNIDVLIHDNDDAYTLKICDFSLDGHIYVYCVEDLINACKYIKRIVDMPNTLKICDDDIKKIKNGKCKY
jgi:hypothetical protein